MQAASQLAPLAVLFATACVPRADYATSPEAIELTLVVEPTFTPAQLMQVVEGARDWVVATDNVTINIRIGACLEKRRQLPDSYRCVIPLTGEEMEETWHCVGAIGCHIGKEQLIMLDVAHLTLEELRTVTAHEIGHAMKLDHGADGTVMAVTLDHQVPPSCKDVVTLWRAHGGAPGHCRLRTGG